MSNISSNVDSLNKIADKKAFPEEEEEEEDKKWMKAFKKGSKSLDRT